MMFEVWFMKQFFRCALMVLLVCMCGFAAAENDLEEVSIQVIDVNNNDTETEAAAFGEFARTNLTNFINGVAPWGQATKRVVGHNGNVIVSVLDQDPEALDGAVLADVIAEIEAIIAEGPMVVEEAPVEEATEEVPAE